MISSLLVEWGLRFGYSRRVPKQGTLARMAISSELSVNLGNEDHGKNQQSNLSQRYRYVQTLQNDSDSD